MQSQVLHSFLSSLLTILLDGKLMRVRGCAKLLLLGIRVAVVHRRGVQELARRAFLGTFVRHREKHTQTPKRFVIVNQGRDAFQRPLCWVTLLFRPPMPAVYFTAIVRFSRKTPRILCPMGHLRPIACSVFIAEGVTASFEWVDQSTDVSFSIITRWGIITEPPWLGRPEFRTGLCFTCGFFFATLSPRSLDRSPWNFATWSESSRIL